MAYGSTWDLYFTIIRKFRKFHSSCLKPSFNKKKITKYRDVMGEHSIEPTFEDICLIMTQVGFVIEVKMQKKNQKKYLHFNFISSTEMFHWSTYSL